LVITNDKGDRSTSYTIVKDFLIKWDELQDFMGQNTVQTMPLPKCEIVKFNGKDYPCYDNYKNGVDLSMYINNTKNNYNGILHIHTPNNNPILWSLNCDPDDPKTKPEDVMNGLPEPGAYPNYLSIVFQHREGLVTSFSCKTKDSKGMPKIFKEAYDFYYKNKDSIHNIIHTAYGIYQKNKPSY